MIDTFANIGRITDLLPVLLFLFLLFKIKKEINKGYWVIFFYCVLVAVNDNILFNLIPTEHTNIVLSIFTLIEYFSFSLFLGFNTNNSNLKKLLKIVFVFFTLFICTYFLVIPFDVIDSVPIGVETILVICFSVYFLYDEVNTSNILISSTPKFWIITAFLIYLSGSFFIYIYANQVPIEELSKIWFLTYIFTSIKNIFISIAFLIFYKNPTIHHPREYQPFLN